MPTSASIRWMTLFALCAFAGNSILCRLALIQTPISADDFSVIRLFGGAGFFVCVLCLRRWRSEADPAGAIWTMLQRWRPVISGLCLFLYAVLFSRAYLLLGAAIGALILFLSVQMSMLAWGLIRGAGATTRVWFGLGLALAGFLILLWPPDSAGEVMAAAWMSLSGLAWAAYSLLGQQSARPLNDTALNFIWTIPWCLLLWWIEPESWSLPADAVGLTDGRSTGVWLALISGVVTSGLGYALWYRALPGLGAIRAGIVQLAVPVLTALAAWVVLDEAHGWRLLMAMALSLAGLALVLSERRQ